MSVAEVPACMVGVSPAGEPNLFASGAKAVIDADMLQPPVSGAEAFADWLGGQAQGCLS
jgi:hypothetical protein